MDNREVEQIARVVHEANRAYCQTIGDDSQKPWDEAEEWQHESSFESVRQVIEHPEITPEDLHVQWMQSKVRDGWKYGPIKDAEKKEHPCLVPYNELPVEQQKKDALIRAIVNALATDDKSPA